MYIKVRFYFLCMNQDASVYQQEEAAGNHPGNIDKSSGYCYKVMSWLLVTSAFTREFTGHPLLLGDFLMFSLGATVTLLIQP